ncbi:hypothetical protein B7486_01630 [cyanobacterium TDX16]|nr:hypothetical protein B7486_01630 [cyanobacterium TDX16]
MRCVMTYTTPVQPDPAAAEPGPIRSSSLGRLWLGFAVAQAMLACLCPLLARLIWLPFYFGLFFFLVGGLLVGAATFRLARPIRPIGRRPLLGGALVVGVVTFAIATVFECRHFANTVSDPPKFATARNAVVRDGGSLREFEGRAADTFIREITKQYSNIGPLAYALWTIKAGKMTLVVDGQSETVSTDHAGWAWLVRALAEILLLAGGLWSSIESLRSPTPVSNLIGPGEEYEE